MEDEDGYPVFEEEDCYPDSYIDVELESVGSKDTCRLRLAIYDEDMAGGFVQYKDQKERIPLYLNHSQTVEPGSGGDPDTRRLFYNEMRQGVADGEYVVTLRYPDVIEVYYLRGKEEREFMLKKQRNEKNCGLIECVAVFAFLCAARAENKVPAHNEEGAGYRGLRLRKGQKSPYKVYYGKQAEDKFTEVLMKSERLMNSGKFGQYRTPDDFVTDDVVAYEYCPELNYVMTTGGHGYAFAYDLETLEEIFVNPSTFVYSPSGCYRFGTFDVEAGTEIYLEVKQGDKWVSHLRGVCPTMIEGVYWFDDQTIHYLKKRKAPLAQATGSDIR